MLNYVIRRLLQIIPLLIGISIINFTIMHLAPGDPVLLLTERNAPPEEVARIRALYGLDDPIYVQYFRWLKQILKGTLAVRSLTVGLSWIISWTGCLTLCT